jgi:hypothetical protein
MITGKIAISIKAGIGIGDALQYSSLPENYFKSTGRKLIDVSRPWFFDHNPYVDRRDTTVSSAITQELWNFSPTKYPWPRPRARGPQVYLSNAEIWASLFGVLTVLNRPRLYRFEGLVPFHNRKMILLHAHGRSHGSMPAHVIKHVIDKYGETECLYQIGHKGSASVGIPFLETPTLWDLARLISESRMLIGVDSGPSWIAACYPDVVVKKVRTRPITDSFKTWVPLEIENIHSHWDDRCHQIFNVSEDDVGFTSSYRRI